MTQWLKTAEGSFVNTTHVIGLHVEKCVDPGDTGWELLASTDDGLEHILLRGTEQECRDSLYRVIGESVSAEHSSWIQP